MDIGNLHPIDRVVRLVAGVTMLAVGWFGVVEGLAEVACKLFGWYPLLTGLMGWSPLYALLGINTCTRRDR